MLVGGTRKCSVVGTRLPWLGLLLAGLSCWLLAGCCAGAGRCLLAEEAARRRWLALADVAPCSAQPAAGRWRFPLARPPLSCLVHAPMHGSHAATHNLPPAFSIKKTTESQTR